MHDIEAPEKPPRSWVKMLLNSALLYLALPNLLLQTAALLLKVDRPFIALEYLFSGVLFAYGWKKSAALLLTIFLITDALAIQGLVYPVLHPRDILYLVSLLPYAAPAWQFAAAGMVLLLAAVVATSWRFAHATSRLATLSLLGIVVLGYAAQSQLDRQSSEFQRTESSLIGSQAAYYVNTRAVIVLDDLFEKVNPLYPVGFKEEISTWVRDDRPQPDKILLIVVESWGAMRDERAHQALLQPIFEIRDRFDWIESGQIESGPTTIEAELRYLCGLGMHYINMKPVTEGLENCLPWQLKSRGYTTTAVHGAAGGMHDRKYWYPRTGFDDMHFGDTDPWKTRCHSFPGICDREIMASFIPETLGKDGRQFVYWLTLNTHAPYDERDIWMEAFDCRAHAMDQGSETCRIAKLHAQFFHQLADILEQPGMKGVEIFMVGDHSPPILDQADFKRNFYRDRTPFLHLRVKK